MSGIKKAATTAPEANYLNGLVTPQMMAMQKLIVQQGCSLYYSIMGSIYNIVNSAMVDAMYLVRQNKKYYHHQIKRDFNMAMQCYEAWNIKMKNQLKGKQYQLWLDVSDTVEEYVRNDVTKLTFAFDNWLLKFGEPDNKLKAKLQTVITLLDIADLIYNKLCDEIEKKSGRDIRPLFRYATMQDIRFYWERACEPIVARNKDNDKEICFNDSQDCKLAVEIIVTKLGSYNTYNNAGNNALLYNHDCWDLLCEEDRMLLKKGMPLVKEEERAPEPTAEQIEKLKSKYA